MSEKSQASHVDSYNDPLPCPLTTRNLRPRLTKTLARTAHRNASRSRESLTGPFGPQRASHDTNLSWPVMPPRAGASSSSSQAGSSTMNQGTGRKVKRRKIAPSQTSEEEVDQLIDEPEDIPITQPAFDSHPHMAPRGAIGASSALSASSSGIAGPSNRALTPETTHVPVSSPSLRKILHPSNIGFSQRSSPTPEPVASTSAAAEVPQDPSPPRPDPLSDYTCPICFFPPTNATLTPCGHICCGSCLFMAVKSTMERGAHSIRDENVARCPVCRAPIPEWDGKGGGVIGLKPRVQFEL